MNVSKSGIGYSAGTKGYRVTKRAGSGVTRTASIPGTGISHTRTVTSKKGSRNAKAKASHRTPPPPSPRSVPTAPQARVLAKPGLMAAKGEKELFKAVQESDIDAVARVAAEHRP